MDPRTVSKYARRIKKARTSFSIGTDLLLSIEIDNMPVLDARELLLALREVGVEYPYLTRVVTMHNPAGAI